MNAINEQDQKTLSWFQPSMLHREFELRSGDTVLARIRWDDIWGTKVTAESAEGSYLFDHSGFLHPHVSVQDTNTGKEVVVNECKWNDTDVIKFPDGHQYNAHRINHYGWEVVDAQGVRIIYTELSYSMTRFEGRVEIAAGDATISKPELDLIILLAWYIAVYKGPQYYNTYTPVII